MQQQQLETPQRNEQMNKEKVCIYSKGKTEQEKVSTLEMDDVCLVNSSYPQIEFITLQIK